MRRVGVELPSSPLCCRDPIIVWANHEDTILDGHNRYRYCRRFDTSFKTKAIVLADRNACRNWIIENQLGRRNVTEEQKAYLRGQRYITEKRVHGTNQHAMEGRSGNDYHSSKTADALAEEYGGSGANQHNTKEQLGNDYPVANRTSDALAERSARTLGRKPRAGFYLV